jgi:hypothetical protein
VNEYARTDCSPVRNGVSPDAVRTTTAAALDFATAGSDGIAALGPFHSEPCNDDQSASRNC